MDMRQPTRNDNIVAFGFIGVMLVIVAVLCIIAMTSGCASFETWALDPITGKMVLVAKGNTNGLLRDYTVKRRYDPTTGRLIEEETSSRSTTNDILGGLNEIGGTLVNAAEKAKP